MTVNDIEKEFELKRDKKRIKELKDFLNSHTLKKLLTIDTELHKVKLDQTLTELNSLYEKYPVIKKRDLNSKINDLKKAIEYRKQDLEYLIKKSEIGSDIKIEALKNEISELETQLKKY